MWAQWMGIWGPLRCLSTLAYICFSQLSRPMCSSPTSLLPLSFLSAPPPPHARSPLHPPLSHFRTPQLSFASRYPASPRMIRPSQPY